LHEHRGGGLGSRLLQTAEDEARGLGGRRLLSEVLDADEGGQAFCERRGFAPNGGHGEQLSRLDVKHSNLAGVEEALTKSGLRIERLADLDLSDGTVIRALYRLDMDSHRDVPSPVEWVDIPFEEWLEAIANGPGRSPDWSWVALDGVDPVGMARLRLYDGNVAGNAYTAVQKDYRGRGIARALKYRTVAWCRDRGIGFIYTGNSVENHRMLAINRALGYEPLPRTIEVVRELG
jgi:GNAT superfamily N-acetyltransferase